MFAVTTNAVIAIAAICGLIHIWADDSDVPAALVLILGFVLGVAVTAVAIELVIN